MFQRLKDKLFWKTQFDSEWHRASIFFNFIKFHHPADQRIREKKYLWREEKGRWYSPRLAAYKAYEEFCEEYYRANIDLPNSEQDFIQMGAALESAAPYLDEEGKYKDSASFLTDKWRTYLSVYRVEREKEKNEEEKHSNEITSFRFDMSELDSAWNRICEGNIPDVASRIWHHAFPRKSGHEIAREAGVTLREFVFWMCVFRRHLGLTEQVVVGTHMYSRNREQTTLFLATEEKRMKHMR
jgi:hypothetical protein